MRRRLGAAGRSRPRVWAATAGVLSGLVMASQVLAGVPKPDVIWERDVGPVIGSYGFPQNDAFDPIVATHPTDPKKLAYIYHRYRPYLNPVLRVTSDGGRTWRDAGGSMWYGSGRAPNWHSALAWGRGPTRGTARLYWVDTTSTGPEYDDHRVSVAYSDDEGASWSRMYVEMRTAATPIGGYPDITVDRDPTSPNFGVVYVVWNWFPNTWTEPSITVLASADHGRTWAMRDLPAAPARPGYPWAHRIGARIRTARDGSGYVSFHQADRSSSSTGQQGFGIVHFDFDRSSRTFTVDPPVLATKISTNSYTTGGASAPGTRHYPGLLPRWNHGIDIHRTSGRVYLGVADYRTSVGSGSPRGIVKVGRSDDHGRTWRWRTVPALPTLSGRQQSAHKPTLTLSGPNVFVGYHTLLDVPFGTDPDLGLATVGNAFAVSYNGGGDFRRNRVIGPSRWDPAGVAHDRNGVGLRDRAERMADGNVIYVYGDGRGARPSPSSDYGESRIYAMLVDLVPKS